MLAQFSNKDLDLEVSSPMEAEEAMVAKITAIVVTGKVHVHLTTLVASSRDTGNKETTAMLKVVATITTTLCSLVTLEMLMSARQRRS